MRVWGMGIRKCIVLRGAASRRGAAHRRDPIAHSLSASLLVLACRGCEAGPTLSYTSSGSIRALLPSRVLPLPAPSPLKVGTSVVHPPSHPHCSRSLCARCFLPSVLLALRPSPTCRIVRWASALARVADMHSAYKLG